MVRVRGCYVLDILSWGNFDDALMCDMPHPSIPSVLMFSLGFLWVPRATLCLAQWADGSIPMNLLVAGQACLHGWRLLLPEVPLPWRCSLVDQLLCCSCCRSQLRGHWWRRGFLWFRVPPRRSTFKKPACKMNTRSVLYCLPRTGSFGVLETSTFQIL